MQATLRGLAILWLLALCAGTPRLAAQPQVATDAQIRAAYIHKFPSFVEWPPAAFTAPGAPFVIAVIDEDRVYAELVKLVSGRPVLGRPVDVVRLAPDSPIPVDIHVLYIGARTVRSGSAGLESWLRRGLLTVSEGESGWRAGAALYFVEDEGRIRFDASPAAAERTGLKLSARLLGVARRVAESAP